MKKFKFVPYFCRKQNKLEKDRLIYGLLQKVELLTLRLEWVEDKIAALELENAELKSRLNSNNSSKPPSGNGYRKKPAFPKSRKGKHCWPKSTRFSSCPNPFGSDRILNLQISVPGLWAGVQGHGPRKG